jgi:hypothetical protein
MSGAEMIAAPHAKQPDHAAPANSPYGTTLHARTLVGAIHLPSAHNVLVSRWIAIIRRGE